VRPDQVGKLLLGQATSLTETAQGGGIPWHMSHCS
jgi:hypothetical protein